MESYLKQTFFCFLGRVRNLLKDGFGIFYNFKFKSYSFDFNKLSLHSIFTHFCFCKRSCDKRECKKRSCNFCARIYAKIFNDENVFHDIIIDGRDITPQFNEFFKGISIFPLDVCHSHLLFMYANKLKFFHVHMLKILKPQINFLGSS